MKFSLLFITSLFIGLYGISQKNNGYYGNKGFIQVESVMSYPLFSNLEVLNDSYMQYSASNNVLVAKKDNFNVGFRITAGYAVKRNVAMSFEFGQDYSSIYPTTEYVYPNPTQIDYYVLHEMIDVKTNVFIPKIEFGTSKSLLPMGLSHQIGFGVSFSKAQEKDYLYRYEGYSSYIRYSTPSKDIDPVNFSTLKPVRRVILLYALSMRSPITKSLMIHYGLRYTLNFGKKTYPNTSFYNQSNIDYTAMIDYLIARQRLYSFMSVNIGLTYAF